MMYQSLGQPLPTQLQNVATRSWSFPIILWSFTLYVFCFAFVGAVLTREWSVVFAPDDSDNDSEWKKIVASLLIAALIAVMSPMFPWFDESAHFYKGEFILPSCMFVFFTALTVVVFTQLENTYGGHFPVWVRVMLVATVVIMLFTAGSCNACQWVDNLASLVLQTLLVITTLLSIEVAIHQNVGGWDQSFSLHELDVHHFQYGVVFSCMFVFVPTHNQSTLGNSILHFVIIFIKAVLFGVCLHGIWSYGPDAAYPAWPLWIAAPTLTLCFLSWLLILLKNI